MEVEIANKPEDFRSRLKMSPLFEGKQREKTMVVGISHLKAIHDHIASEVFQSSIVFLTRLHNHNLLITMQSVGPTRCEGNHINLGFG